METLKSGLLIFFVDHSKILDLRTCNQKVSEEITVKNVTTKVAQKVAQNVIY